MELVNAHATATDLPPLSPHDEAPLDDLQFTDEEFTEADVLPFLLQAQDIIAKLESRVVELETDLSVSKNDDDIKDDDDDDWQPLYTN